MDGTDTNDQVSVALLVGESRVSLVRQSPIVGLILSPLQLCSPRSWVNVLNVSSGLAESKTAPWNPKNRVCFRCFPFHLAPKTVQEDLEFQMLIAQTDGSHEQ